MNIKLEITEILVPSIMHKDLNPGVIYIAHVGLNVS